MDHCVMRPSLVSKTVARLRNQACNLYRGPHTTSAPCQCGFSGSVRYLNWRQHSPGSLEAVAGLARQAQHESLQQQSQQQQPELLSVVKQVQPKISDREPTGAFARLPIVPVSSELIESALKRAAKVSGSKKVKNEAQKARSKAASQMDTLTKEVCMPLGKYMKGFPAVHRLHPFEIAMLELTCGTAPYEQALSRIDSLRKSLLQMGKGYAGQANKASNKADAASICEEGFKQVESVYLKSARAVDDLKQVAQKLRRLPVVDPLQPVVALVGAPNVGKSSLVNVLSSGVPEVCDYPFTTRSVKMGHFFINGHRHQVTDTPGLLNRPLAERNAMERLTLACLQHLPSTVLFVLDLTAQCGTSVADQLAIREALLADFPGKLWLDVLSKADLLQVDFDAADAMRHSGNETASNVTANTQATQQALSQSNNDTDSLHEGMTQQQNPARHLQHHTVHDSNVGRNDKQEAVDQCEGAEDAAAAAENTPVAAAGVQQGEEQHNHLSAKGSLVSQQPESYRPQGQGAEEDCSSSDAQLSDHDTPAADATASHSNDVSSLSVAAQVALMLPNAVRISSVTQFGIQQLQQDVTKLLAKQLEADTDLQTSDVPA